MKTICTELLLVLVDFLEVLVGVNLKLTASSLVTSNDTVLVKLKCADGPSVVNAALDAVTESTSLAVTVDEEKYLLRGTNGSNTNRKSGLGNLVGIVVEEAGVYDKSVLGKSADTGSGVKGGEGLVESDVTVNAAAAEEEVDSAVGSDLVLISLALSLEVLSHTVKNVDILSGNVYVVEEIGVHEVPVALVMLTGKTNVLVHVEGNNVLEGNLACLVHFDKILVNAERGGTGRKSENERTVFLVVVDSVSDVLSSPLAHCFVVVFDDKFHSFYLFLGFFIIIPIIAIKSRFVKSFSIFLKNYLQFC